MISGSCAGVMEHVVMYPVDTVKTRMQATHLGSPKYSGVFTATRDITRHEGFFRLYRGLPAVAAAAIPSHALHFAVYETARRKLGGGKAGVFADMAAGAIATSCHDGLICPIDVVKQRMQLYDSPHRRISSAFRAVYAERGIRTFYAAYPVTLMMNVPYFAVYFSSYQKFRKLLTPKDGSYSALTHIISGAGAGMFGAAISNPLDVIKTRLQTQVGAGNNTFHGLATSLKDVVTTHGVGGFFAGVSARMLYHMPAAAVCWMTYEYIKHTLAGSRYSQYILREHDHDDDDDDHH